MTSVRFHKIKRDGSKSINEDCVQNINAYWRLTVAHVSNDGHVRTDGHLRNGVPAIANDVAFSYSHDDIVWVKWDGRKLILTRQKRR